MDLFSLSPTHSVHIRDVFSNINKVSIEMTVVGRSTAADKYVEQLRRLHVNHSNIMALNIEMKGNKEIAVPNLCVGTRCIIFQLSHMEEGLPQSLKKLLLDRSITFVGVRIESINKTLTENYGVTCKNICDLGRLCAWFLANPDLQHSLSYRRIADDALCLPSNSIPDFLPSKEWSNRFLSIYQISCAAKFGYVTAAAARKFLKGC